MGIANSQKLGSLIAKSQISLKFEKLNLFSPNLYFYTESRTGAEMAPPCALNQPLSAIHMCSGSLQVSAVL